MPREVKRALDVGCGKGIVGALLRMYRDPDRIVGIDAFPPYLEFCKKTGLYDDLMNFDLRKSRLPFETNEFDLATGLEVVEHLPKEDGSYLLDELQRVAGTVIVSTPNRFYRQSPYDRNPLQVHRSRWHVNDFISRGYSVYGVGGLLIFGREIGMISYALGRMTIPFPRLSGNILCVYSKPKSSGVRHESAVTNVSRQNELGA